MSVAAGTYLEASGDPVEMKEAMATWVPLARETLLRTAKTYNSYLTYGDLAAELQMVSGIRTKQLTHRWIGSVLGVVSTDCYSADEPLLSSLCVYKNGSVGAGYAKVLDGTYGGPRPDDLDLAAADERLKCYLHFNAEMPEQGGQPTLTPMLAASRRGKSTVSRARKEVEVERPICATCHLQLPTSGVCGTCE